MCTSKKRQCNDEKVIQVVCPYVGLYMGAEWQHSNVSLSLPSEDGDVDGELNYLECEESSGYLIFNREVGRDV